jgi:hypothetical protein
LQEKAFKYFSRLAHANVAFPQYEHSKATLLKSRNSLGIARLVPLQLRPPISTVGFWP